MHTQAGWACPGVRGHGNRYMESIWPVVVGAERELSQLLQEHSLPAAEPQHALRDQGFEGLGPALLVRAMAELVNVEIASDAAHPVPELLGHDLLEPVGLDAEAVEVVDLRVSDDGLDGPAWNAAGDSAARTYSTLVWWDDRRRALCRRCTGLGSEGGRGDRPDVTARTASTERGLELDMPRRQAQGRVAGMEIKPVSRTIL
jgi:hypothetical protein